MSSSSVPSSASSGSPSAFPSSSDRFSPITQYDHAGYLWITTLLTTTYAILSILVRWYIKRRCFGIDDSTCVAATLLGIGAFIATFVALNQGLGKAVPALDDIQLQDIGESVFASRILWVTASVLSKCSVVSLIRRLLSEDMIKKRSICDAVLVLVVLWGLGSVIAVSARCDPRHVIEVDGHCSTQFARWGFIGIFDAISETIILLLPVGLVWGLQMRAGLKARVILAFIFRLPLIAIAIFHLFTIKWAYSSPNPNFAIIPALTCEQAELGYSLISATIPNLKSFIISFNTSMMMDVSHKLPSQRESYTDLSARIASSSSDRAPRLSDVETRENFIRRLRPETELGHIVSVQHTEDSDENESIGNLGRESLDRIIRRDIQWTVVESLA